MKKIKEQYIQNGRAKISDNEFNSFKEKYLNILNQGKEELKKDYNTNAYKDDERKLLDKLIKYCDNYLLFLKKVLCSIFK